MNLHRLLLVACLFFCRASTAQEGWDRPTRKTVMHAEGMSLDEVERENVELPMVYLQFGRETCVKYGALRFLIENRGRFVDYPFLTAPLLGQNSIADDTPWSADYACESALNRYTGRSFMIIGGVVFPSGVWEDVCALEDFSMERLLGCVLTFEPTDVYPFASIKLCGLRAFDNP